MHKKSASANYIQYQPEPTIIQQAKQVDVSNKRKTPPQRVCESWNFTEWQITAGLQLTLGPLKPSGNIFAMRYG